MARLGAGNLAVFVSEFEHCRLGTDWCRRAQNLEVAAELCLFADDGTVKVLDFGLAKALDALALTTENATTTNRAMTQIGTILGSAAHMSPEQATGFWLLQFQALRSAP
jgi:hypothetical protein